MNTTSEITMNRTNGNDIRLQPWHRYPSDKDGYKKPHYFLQQDVHIEIVRQYSHTLLLVKILANSISRRPIAYSFLLTVNNAFPLYSCRFSFTCPRTVPTRLHVYDSSSVTSFYLSQFWIFVLHSIHTTKVCLRI